MRSLNTSNTSNTSATLNGLNGLGGEGGNGKSYYEVYPERRRMGAYIPKHALVSYGVRRRSRSGNQLEFDSSATFVCESKHQLQLELELQHQQQQQHQENEKEKQKQKQKQKQKDSALRLKNENEAGGGAGAVLTVPSTRRLQQRSVSCSAFERVERGLDEEERGGDGRMGRRDGADERLSSKPWPSRHMSGRGMVSGGERLTQQVRVSHPGLSDLVVSFSEVGLEAGHVVLVFLGLGASRLLIGLYHEVASALGLRLVCVDRWGIGRTQSVGADRRSILGWSLVVEQVVEYLGVDTFSMLAHSAGAPFAAAVAFLFPHRVQGPLHLLAPWTGRQPETGYRWLRYIPGGVIKTAQAAEWKIQNWKLGKEGTRCTSRTTTPKTMDEHARNRRTSEAEEKHTQPTTPTLALDMTHKLEHYQYPATTTSTQEASDPMLTECARHSALDLLRASQAESARGLVDDLNLVLAKRGWGFGYADVNVACEVWHGTKDERIPVSSSISLSKEMRECRLHLVDGASHSLMTNSEVVVEVFESIRRHSVMTSSHPTSRAGATRVAPGGRRRL